MAVHRRSGTVTNAGVAVPGLQRTTLLRSRCAAPGTLSLEGLIRLAHLAADAIEASHRRLVVLVDVHRARVRAGRAFLVAEPFISEPAAGPGGDVLRLDA